MVKRQLTPEFREFLACLNRAGVEYLLGGGYAVNHYGYHRFTGDIDFWIAVSDANFDRLLETVRLFFGENLAVWIKSFYKTMNRCFSAACRTRSKCSNTPADWNFRWRIRAALRPRLTASR